MIDRSTRFAASDVAVYNSEEDAWYRLGDEPWKVRDEVRGQPAKTFVRTKAMCYQDAYEKLFGHAVLLPPLAKNPSRGEVE